MSVDPRAHAARLLGAIDPADRESLASHPEESVIRLYDIEVRNRPSAPAAGGCSIDGSYDPGPPAIIWLSDEMTTRWRNFTVLHELGHHLIEYDAELADLDVGDAERRDEDICDQIAASLLLPHDLVAEALPAGTPTGSGVTDLYEQSNASRSACCVEAANRLGRPGCVMLVEPGGVAVFTAHHPSNQWRVGRQTQQDDALILSSTPGQSQRGRGRVRFASGGSSGEMFGDVYHGLDGWIVVVFVDDTVDPWREPGGLNLPVTGRWDDAEEVECPHCDEWFRAFKSPCKECGDYQCSHCGRCSCSPTSRAHKRCDGCTMLRPQDQFPNDGDYCESCL